MLYGRTAAHTVYITIVMSAAEILTCGPGFHDPSLSCLEVLGIGPELFLLMVEADLKDEINERVSVSCSVCTVFVSDTRRPDVQVFVHRKDDHLKNLLTSAQHSFTFWIKTGDLATANPNFMAASKITDYTLHTQ